MIKIFKIKNQNSGFVILYSILVASILLSVALGISSISVKEIKLSSSARDGNVAFFSADTGAECALFFDKKGYFDPASQPMSSVFCNGEIVNITSGLGTSFDFSINNSSGGNAVVHVLKDPTTNSTIINSKGYNTTNLNASNRVEREIEVSYTQTP